MSGAPALNGAGADLQGMAERRRQESLILGERAKEQALQTRVTALQLATQVSGPSGDHSVVLRSAAAFAAFILGEDQAPAH